jgi:hypothetical protein
MNSHELNYSESLLAIDDKRKEMRRDILWYLYTCIVLLNSMYAFGILRHLNLPLISPMLDYSIDGRVCKAGMTSKGRCNTI